VKRRTTHYYYHYYDWRKQRGILEAMTMSCLRHVPECWQMRMPWALTTIPWHRFSPAGCTPSFRFRTCCRCGFRSTVVHQNDTTTSTDSAHNYSRPLKGCPIIAGSGEPNSNLVRCGRYGLLIALHWQSGTALHCIAVIPTSLRRAGLLSGSKLFSSCSAVPDSGRLKRCCTMMVDW